MVDSHEPPRDRPSPSSKLFDNKSRNYLFVLFILNRAGLKWLL